VDDILVHPRENDLIVATHARGVWIADDISALQQATADAREQPVVLFDIRPAVAWLVDRQRGQQTGGQKVFAGENPPAGAIISYYLKSAATGRVRITIDDAAGRVIRTLDGSTGAGINRVLWDLTAQQGQRAAVAGGGRGATPVQPGSYSVVLEAGDAKLTKPLIVLEDAWMREGR
jgi:hypothetical protein